LPAATRCNSTDSWSGPAKTSTSFTVQSRSAEFDAAITAITAAYQADGLDVAIDKYDPALDPTFARLVVSDDRDISKVELLADWRANRPRHLSIRCAGLRTGLS